IFRPPAPSASMRSRPWMVLRLTTRLGRTMYALRLVSRSCPPAMAWGVSSGSTLPPGGLSSFTASSTVEALAHSNEFMALPSLLLLLHQALEDLVGGDRQFADADAAGVVDGVGDRADAGDVGALGHADDRLPRVAVVDDRDQ